MRRRTRGQGPSLLVAVGVLQWTAKFECDMQALVQRDGIVYAGGHQGRLLRRRDGSGRPVVCDQPLTRNKFAALDERRAH